MAAACGEEMGLEGGAPRALRLCSRKWRPAGSAALRTRSVCACAPCARPCRAPYITALVRQGLLLRDEQLRIGGLSTLARVPG